MLEFPTSIQGLENTAYQIIFAYKLEFFVAFVVIFAGRRFLRIIYGHKFKTGTLITSPLMYFAFSGISLLGIDLLGLLYCSVAFFFGLMISTVFKHGVKFYRKNNVIYYKRSAVISLTWTAAFIARVYIEIFYDITQGLVLAIFLIFLSGLILGEAFHIGIQKRIYENSDSDLEYSSMLER